MSGSRKTRYAAEREDPVRTRIRQATFKVLMERGYAGTSTLEIATRARVSKRELYTLFGNKQALLADCIAERAKEMRMPLEIPAVRDRESLVQVLERFGAAVLRAGSKPTTSAMFQLAVAEGERSPEVARALDTLGIQATRGALTRLLVQARSDGLLEGSDPSLMAEQFLALLWGGLRLRLLLRLAAPPGEAEIKRRAQVATEALLVLQGSNLTATRST